MILNNPIRDELLIQLSGHTAQIIPTSRIQETKE